MKECTQFENFHFDDVFKICCYYVITAVSHIIRGDNICIITSSYGGGWGGGGAPVT